MTKIDNDVGSEYRTLFCEMRKKELAMDIFLKDYQRGYFFLTQFAFDLFEYTLAEEHHIISNYHTFTHKPLNAFIFNLVTLDFHFQHFKKNNVHNETLAFYTSVVLAKNIHRKLYFGTTRSLKKYKTSTMLDFQLTAQQDEQQYAHFQRQLFKEFKNNSPLAHTFELTIENSIIEGKALYYFHH